MIACVIKRVNGKKKKKKNHLRDIASVSYSVPPLHAHSKEAATKSAPVCENGQVPVWYDPVRKAGGTPLSAPVCENCGVIRGVKPQWVSLSHEHPLN